MLLLFVRSFSKRVYEARVLIHAAELARVVC